MNAYQRRQRERKAKRKPKAHGANEARLLQRAVQANAIMGEYEEAHMIVTGVSVRCQYRNGWVTVNGERMRLGDLEKATQMLWAAEHENELNVID